MYKITTKYAARVPVNTQITPSTLGEGFEWGKGLFSRMRNYYGEPILQAGKFQILHNIGFQMPAGIPEHLSKTMSEHQQKNIILKNICQSLLQFHNTIIIKLPEILPY